MIIRLTHNQGKAVIRRAPTDVAEALVAHRVTYGVAQHEYLLPAIGWRRALDAMLATCYGPAGGKLKTKGRPPDSAYGAIGRIANGLRKVEAHPALREASVMGWVGDVLPAFMDEHNRLSAYPNGGAFVLLVPNHLELGRRRVTCWVPAGPTELALLQPQSLAYQEDFHLLLQGGVGAH